MAMASVPHKHIHMGHTRAEQSRHKKKKRKKLLFCVEPMFEIQHGKANLMNIADCESTGFRRAAAYGNGNNKSHGIHRSWDIRRLCMQGGLKEALHILRVMDGQGVRADSFIYASLLQQCANEKSLSHGKVVHAHMIRTGFNPDVYLGNKLVIMYAKCGVLADARRVLDEMPERNVVAWTVLIAAYSRHGLDEEALTLFDEMQGMGFKPNEFTFASALSACGKLAAVERGRKIHEDLMNCGFQCDTVVWNALVDMYAKCGRVVDARHVFDKISERNQVSWNAMISGYAQNGHVNDALELFQRMPRRDVVSWNTMIAGYAQNGPVDEALKLFEKMPERDVVSWNAVIAGYVQNGHVDNAMKLFQKMKERNAVSWNAIIAGCVQNRCVDEALKLFQKIPERNVVSWNAMIAGHALNGHVEDALRLFHQMPERNEVSWNTMIAAYAQNEYFNEALNVFRQMQLTGAKPDPVTFTSALSACANLATLNNGKQVHGNIIRSGFQLDVVVGRALVDMYAKCGIIQDAYKVFGEIPVRDVVSWTAMIVGYGMHGYGREALQLFEQMYHSGTKPDHVTFIGVLSACCHAGLVEDGCQYFARMDQDYHIKPTVDHYCCMVDLLGRAGHLDEVQDLINNMPVKPNAALWSSVLGACRIHANTELGERVAAHLFELEPKNAGCYILLSNIYAAAGRWDDVEKVRKIMKDRRVKRSPGCSWIEVNNKVHSFLARDRSHPQTQKIYAELERLSRLMEEAGYVADKNVVLHDVEEQKKHIL